MCETEGLPVSRCRKEQMKWIEYEGCVSTCRRDRMYEGEGYGEAIEEISVLHDTPGKKLPTHNSSGLQEVCRKCRAGVL